MRVGLEIEIDDGEIVEIRPNRGLADDFVLAPAFVNAHSHLEYRGLQGLVRAESYWPWLRELTAAKSRQPEDAVLEWALVAAGENRATGVALIGEHSDRPVSGLAIERHGLEGIIFQEVITVGEADPHRKLKQVQQRVAKNQAVFRGQVVPSPHAYWTVDEQTLSGFREGPLSVHVAESQLERECFVKGTGAMAEALASWEGPTKDLGLTAVLRLDALGLARPGTQFVHCCDLDDTEIALIAERRVSVAHCPRSNVRLQCPGAPMRELLAAGVQVGLGMDSPASGGPIDMFAEMRAALNVARQRGRPLTPEEVWTMATVSGAASLGRPSWDIEVGSRAPLLKLHIGGAVCTEDLICRGRPDLVEWV